jgi:predicted Zn-dependent protease
VTSFHLAAVPVGRVHVEELEQALHRAAKVLRRPFELREALPVPRGTEDVARAQHRAAALLERLGAEVLKLRPGRLVGASDPEAKTPLDPCGFVFVTDVDLFTAKSDGVVAALLAARRCAIVSVRRLREAFYRRRADPERQCARLTKELLRMAGRLRGLPECANADCLLAPSRSPLDIDAKEERFCRACEQRLFEGTMRI